jgi:hypothetical protein
VGAHIRVKNCLPLCNLRWIWGTLRHRRCTDASPGPRTMTTRNGEPSRYYMDHSHLHRFFVESGNSSEERCVANFPVIIIGYITKNHGHLVAHRVGRRASSQPQWECQAGRGAVRVELLEFAIATCRSQGNFMRSDVGLDLHPTSSVIFRIQRTGKTDWRVSAILYNKFW